ncbi:MAG: DUF4340 domain-containing protein [Woeseiaceae bacterium]
MTTRQVKTLAIVLVVLIASLVAINVSENQGDTSGSGLLFPELKAHINDVEQMSINKAGESLTVNNTSGKWVLAERDDYPADTGKLRQLLLALADATMLEEKTSNPEMYARLGVEDISEVSKGTEIRISGPDLDTALIIGNLAQRKYRYARIPGQDRSWLINQNPSLPRDVGGWLLPEIIDIETSRIRSVTITHTDGESIHIEKEDEEASDFAASDIPEGRELRYPSIVNGIAGVVSKLNLEDVAAASEAEPDGSLATTVFTTFDGLEVAIESSVRDEDTWISVSANQADTESDQAAGINRRLGGWEYQIQSYKADQLRRRWDDILKEEEKEE